MSLFVYLSIQKERGKKKEKGMTKIVIYLFSHLTPLFEVMQKKQEQTEAELTVPSSLI
jgi:hypothetical protein